MIKAVTSVTVWNDAVGKRMSMSYSEIDETTGKIIADNKRLDRVITDTDAKSMIDTVISYAQSIVEEME